MSKHKKNTSSYMEEIKPLVSTDSTSLHILKWHKLHQ